MALTYTPTAEPGSLCPDFDLPTLMGTRFGRKDIAPQTPFVVMFICNHCPYVKAIEDRLLQLGKDLQAAEIPLLAICSNDASEYPEDSFEALRKNYLDKKMNFIYLHDPSQKVAQSFCAVCTPDFFVYDANQKLAYRGRLDDSWKEPSRVTRRELYESALLLKQNKPAPLDQVSSMGCSIKWIQK